MPWLKRKFIINSYDFSHVQISTLKGLVKIGTVPSKRFIRISEAPEFNIYCINISRPHEAKCCTSFLDATIYECDDPNAKLKVQNLMDIRNVHSLYKALKRINCVMCGRMSPGL